jgi:hypothetical protein
MGPRLSESVQGPSALGKWLAGIIATVLGGVLTWVVIAGLSETPKDAPDTVVPTVTGLSQTDAEKAIVAAGLQPSAEATVDPLCDFGKVTKQFPSAGTSMPQASAVHIVYCVHPTTVLMPVLVGLSGQNAQDVLHRLGIFGITTVDVDSGLPKGQVIATVPNAGADVKSSSSVQLKISKGPGCPGGIVKIRLAGTNRLIDMPGGTHDPNVQIVQRHDSGTNTARDEQWTFTDVGGGWFAITSVESGLILSLLTTPPADHVAVVQYYPRNGDHQRWQCVADGPTNQYKIATKANPGFVLDVIGGQTDDGVGIQIYTGYPDALNQRWEFIPVGG